MTCFGRRQCFVNILCLTGIWSLAIIPTFKTGLFWWHVSSWQPADYRFSLYEDFLRWKMWHHHHLSHVADKYVSKCITNIFGLLYRLCYKKGWIGQVVEWQGAGASGGVERVGAGWDGMWPQSTWNGGWKLFLSITGTVATHAVAENLFKKNLFHGDFSQLSFLKENMEIWGSKCTPFFMKTWWSKPYISFYPNKSMSLCFSS